MFDGEDRAAAGAIAVELAPQLRLDGDVLEHRLDDEVGVRGPREVGGRLEAGRASRRARPGSAGPSRRPAPGCRRSGRGPPPRARGPARRGRRACRSRRGPGRCRGPSARRPRRRRARSPSPAQRTAPRRSGGAPAGRADRAATGRRPSAAMTADTRNVGGIADRLATRPSTAGESPKAASTNSPRGPDDEPAVDPAPATRARPRNAQG